MVRELGTAAATLWQSLKALFHRSSSWRRLPLESEMASRHGPAGSSPVGGSPRAYAPRRGARAAWQSLLVATLLVASLLAGLAFGLKHRHALYKGGQDVASAVRYLLDKDLSGRRHENQPAPACCLNEGCLPRRQRQRLLRKVLEAAPAQPHSGRRVAVVTYVLGAAYLPLFWQLECTLRRSNPGLELAAMVVEGELEAEALQSMRGAGVTLIPVEPLEFENVYQSR